MGGRYLGYLIGNLFGDLLSFGRGILYGALKGGGVDGGWVPRKPYREPSRELIGILIGNWEVLGNHGLDTPREPPSFKTLQVLGLGYWT